MKRIAVIGTGFRKAGNATPPQEILDLKAAGFDPFLIETRLPSFPFDELHLYRPAAALPHEGALRVGALRVGQ